MSEYSNDLRWYVLQTKPKQEKRTCFNLNSFGIETFFPQILKKYKNKSRLRHRYAEALFPRYVFANFSYLNMFSKIKYTRGVQKIVGFGQLPFPVDQEIIEIIKLKISQDEYKPKEDGFKPGDQVIVNKPYLNDFIGVFEYEMKEQDRVSILLTTISYQAHMIVPKEHVSKID
jgi:transcriptional antiterminator RfaH